MSLLLNSTLFVIITLFIVIVCGVIISFRSRKEMKLTLQYMLETGKQLRTRKDVNDYLEWKRNKNIK